MQRCAYRESQKRDILPQGFTFQGTLTFILQHNILMLNGYYKLKHTCISTI